MCGRLNVIDEPLSQIVSETLGIEFTTSSNNNLCPSQKVAAVAKENGCFQVNATWGIKPNWSKNVLINAQSETVHQKATFENAFLNHRCVVPCSGWYEWRLEGGRKVKYLFEHSENQPLFMGGILYNPQSPQLVTLTVKPNEKCSQYHHRMPLLIEPENLDYWFHSTPDELMPLMRGVKDDLVNVFKC
ncbi:SOS response-associated peptidase family protein [Thalassotalea sp. G2M2-11]|uniref:SOS response-associated peptidase n=1 Tax=Thalassotalea sp. G2M2-11 TaxID=2787627 RepID=UPI0019D304AE|nr:SOS response-associated peptidase family protein [Thalassotalea sp. G2M2-11]